LSILALPWQTRWFHDASLAGWPWEQGRWSIYVSWGLIVATVVVGYFCRRGGVSPPSVPADRTGRGNRAPISVLIAIAILLSVSAISVFRDTRILSAVSEWWIQMFILGCFSWTLYRARISRQSLAVWFVISLVPHVVLGVWQYAVQTVIGSKWLGIAEQLPKLPGVSVVEFGEFRFLRAYGGFPHPNIFGGWLAVGLIVCLWLSTQAESKKAALSAALASAALSVALLLTYSRSAWIATVVGIVVLVGARFPRPVRSTDMPEGRHAGGRGNPAPTQFLYVAIAASILTVGSVGYSQRAVVFARSDVSARLEAKSIDAREQSLRNGADIFIHHPLIGTGPNAELISLVPAKGKALAPLEPPHDLFLLALDDVGIIGFAALAYLVWLCLFALRKRHRLGQAFPFLAAIFILALFDHYLWSTWSGQCLLAFVLVFAFAPADEHEGGREIERGEAHVHRTEE
jgi:hypothetical protein